MRVLSTKKLSSSLKSILPQEGMELVEYNAIKIEPIPFIAPKASKHFIFTSQNAVNLFLAQTKKITLETKNVFCVGEKTKALLHKNGFQIMEVARNASRLANTIVSKYATDSFVFFCGNKRRGDLPNILTENNITYEEIIIYKTHLYPKKFGQGFDSILFFSPSAIESFTLENGINTATAYCIGSTTATEAKKYTDKIIIAPEPTVEAVLRQVNKQLTLYDQK